MNDVESFPDDMEPGVFKPGDLMISLRNINTVLVFDPDTLKIVYINTGGFVRQHDPDFLDGNRISVFDNNLAASDEANPSSRIVIVDARDNTREIYYQGTLEKPFYTAVMGKHQWLPNGHLLITDSHSGRAFEINSNKEIVWEYYNFIDEDVVAVVEEVQRIPESFREAY